MKQTKNTKSRPKEGNRKAYTERVTVLLTKEQKMIVDKQFPSYKRGDRIRQILLDALVERKEGEPPLAPQEKPKVSIDLSELERDITNLNAEVLALRKGQNQILARLFELIELVGEHE